MFRYVWDGGEYHTYERLKRAIKRTYSPASAVITLGLTELHVRTKGTLHVHTITPADKGHFICVEPAIVLYN